MSDLDVRINGERARAAARAAISVFFDRGASAIPIEEQVAGALEPYFATVKEEVERLTAWLPIETAPTGINLLVLKSGQREPMIAFHLSDTGKWNYEYDHLGFDETVPEFWMPLPSPPEPTHAD